ncbi:MAG TPA: hypothetical protein VLU94_03520, partial [Candidatus Nitrosotalea sp.]|nr:hypothetical protein [Candidatus Nitrosotalea sp.]
MSTNIEKIEDLFNRALDHPTGERAAFLAEACGRDPDLLVRVRALLQAHDAGDGILPDEPRSAAT